MMWFANSDRGRRRKKNEDRYTLLPLGEGSLFAAVFDGMGGHAAGDLAASLAETVFRETVTASPPADTLGAEALLTLATAEADRAISSLAARDPDSFGMGTTVTALLLVAGKAVIANVGDSRAYLLRGGELFRLTRDDSCVQDLVDAGQLSPCEAENHPRRHVLSAALGALRGRAPTVTAGAVCAGDRLLLCSDGLYDMIGDGGIRRLLVQPLAPDEAVGYLIAAANEHGGRDNITAVLIDL